MSGTTNLEVTETLILDFDAGFAIGCKYNIRSYDQIKITSKQEMEQLNKLGKIFYNKEKIKSIV